MDGIKQQPALRINRPPRQIEPAAKPDNGGARQFLEAIGGVAASLAQTAAGAAGGPGMGSMVGNLLGGGLGGGTLGPLGNLGGAAGGTDFANQLALIQLQRQIQQQTQIFETLSNVSKAEHDARMSAVRNIRP